MLVELLDGAITEIKSDRHYSPGGCETCDYGSVYVSEYKIFLTNGAIRIEAEDDYDYPLTEGFMMKLMLTNIEEIKNKTEIEFYEWLDEKIDHNVHFIKN